MQRLCLSLFLVLFLFSILWNGYSQNNIDPSLSDLDANGQIDANDILQFAQQWKQPGAADLDGDGTVGPKDLLLMWLISTSPIRFTKPGIINEIQIQIPAQGGAIDIPNIGTITVPNNAVEESFTTTVGQLELNDRDIAAGLSVAVDFKTVTVPYEGSSLQMEFQLNQSYSPGTELDILNVVYASEVGETFMQGLDDLPIITYVGPAIVTDSGDRAVGSIPAPSGKYIIDEPLETIFFLDDNISGKQVNPKDVKPAQTQEYELIRAPNTTAGAIPVILIHGIHGEEDAQENWEGLYQFLDNDPSQFDERLFIYDTTTSFDESEAGEQGNSISDHAKQLVSHINTNITGTEPLVLIAHSMGGLVSRDAMQTDSSFSSRIAALLTLGTPHHGSPLAHPLWSKYGFQENHYDIFGDDIFEINFAHFFDRRAVFRESQRNGDLDTVFHFVVQRPWEQNARDLLWDNFDNSMPIDVEVNKKHRVLLYRKSTLVLGREPREGNFPNLFNLLTEPSEWYLQDLNQSVPDEMLRKLICYAGIIPESGQLVSSTYSSLLLQAGIQIPISLNLKPLLPGPPSGAKPLDMVWIEPGTFMMGSPSDERGRESDEGPVHEVEITQGFYMGKYEVTQAQYEAVIGEDPSFFLFDGINKPVERVLWYDAAEFCNRLSEIKGGESRWREWWVRNTRPTLRVSWYQVPGRSPVGRLAMTSSFRV